MLEGSVGSIAALTTTGVRMTPCCWPGWEWRSASGRRVQHWGGGATPIWGRWATIAGLMPLGVPGWIHVPLACWAGLPGARSGPRSPDIFWRTEAQRGRRDVDAQLRGIYLASYLVDTERPTRRARGVVLPVGADRDGGAPAGSGLSTSLHLGLVIGLVLAVALWAMIRWTPFGFRLRMIGANPTARYAGVEVGNQIVSVMALSGGLAGLAGAVEVIEAALPPLRELLTRVRLRRDCGGTAGEFAPPGSRAGGWLFRCAAGGSGRMQQTVNIETSLVFIIQALTVIFVIAAPKKVGRFTFPGAAPGHRSRKRGGGGACRLMLSSCSTGSRRAFV